MTSQQQFNVEVFGLGSFRIAICSGDDMKGRFVHGYRKGFDHELDNDHVKPELESITK